MDSTPAVTQQLLQAIVAQYGTRLTEAQRAAIEQYLERIARTVRALRAYPLSNADEPLLMGPPYVAEERNACPP